VSADLTQIQAGVIATGAEVTGRGLAHIGRFHNKLLPASLGGQFGSIAVGPAGQVVADYQADQFASSVDLIQVQEDPGGIGGTFGNPVTAATTRIFKDIPGFQIPAATPGRGISARVSLAFDSSGRLYLAYADADPANFDNTDVFLIHSDDNGLTWSAPLKVNDDATANSQFMPALAVDPVTGDVAVSWYDARNSAADNRVQEYAAVSTDRGASFRPNLAVGPGFSGGTSFDQFLGDYNGVAFLNGAFYPAWSDNSNSTGDNPDGALSFPDIYTARVAFQPVDTAVTATAGPGPTTFRVRLDPTGQNLQVYENNPALAGAPTYTTAFSRVRTLTVTGQGANDTLIVDFSNGSPLPPGGLTNNGGGQPGDAWS
jgi:hypothetical protein